MPSFLNDLVLLAHLLHDWLSGRDVGHALATVSRLGNAIPFIFLLVELVETDPEEDATHEGKACNDCVVPDLWDRLVPVR